MSNTLTPFRGRQMYGGAVATMGPAVVQDRSRALATDRAAAWPYPWSFPPQDEVPFNPTGSIAAPAYGSQVVVAEYQVPQGYEGALWQTYMGFVGAGYVLGSGDIVWTIDINSPLGVSALTAYTLPDLANIVVPFGSPIEGPFKFAAPYLLREGDTVRLKATSVANISTGAPNFMVGYIGGWTWPVESQHRR